jgi:preprotein translocase SecF subunit
MFNLMEKRRWFFLISAILLGVGAIAMIYSTLIFGAPLRMGIDFTSGSMIELQFAEEIDVDVMRGIIADSGFTDVTVQRVGGGDHVVIRTRPMEIEVKEALRANLEAEFGASTELRFESVGPAIGQETTRAAITAILSAGVAILFFITIAFRRVPNAFRYGVCAMIKMFHDVLFLLGFASIMGIVAGWEVDALYLTAMITVLGFSVEDVIVVFDRIRENIRRRRGEEFGIIINRSLLETLHRSLATQTNAMFVMLAIIFIGGATIRQFMIVMLVGMVVDSYSSLFFAVPLLAAWENGDFARLFRRPIKSIASAQS